MLIRSDFGRFKRTKVSASVGEEEEEVEERVDSEELVEGESVKAVVVFGRDFGDGSAQHATRATGGGSDMKDVVVEVNDEEDILTQCGRQEISKENLCLLPRALDTSLQNALREQNSDKKNLTTQNLMQLENVLLREIKKLIMELEQEGIISCPRLRWDGKSSSDEKTLIRRFGFLINAYHVRPFPAFPSPNSPLCCSLTLSFPRSLTFSLLTHTLSPSPFKSSLSSSTVD